MSIEWEGRYPRRWRVGERIGDTTHADPLPTIVVAVCWAVFGWIAGSGLETLYDLDAGLGLIVGSIAFLGFVAWREAARVTDRSTAVEAPAITPSAARTAAPPGHHLRTALLAFCSAGVGLYFGYLVDLALGRVPSMTVGFAIILPCCTVSWREAARDPKGPGWMGSWRKVLLLAFAGAIGRAIGGGESAKILATFVGSLVFGGAVHASHLLGARTGQARRASATTRKETQ